MTSATPPGRVLLIEDDAVLGGALRQRLTLEGFDVTWTTDCASALAALSRGRPDFVLSDIRLPDGSGETFYRRALPLLASTPIVFATAFADLPQAVRLVRAGADDYLTKPIDVDALVERIQATLDSRMRPVRHAFDTITPMRSLAADLTRLSARRVPVLLRGETGVGKEVAARSLHAQSPWHDAPFVAINCGAVATELAESRFFGHERGSFTGATAAHAGFFEQTGVGTLFLDEVGELDPRLQTALLRVLQDGTYRRIGGRADQAFRGRVIAATNADLDARIADGRFRADLYFRLAVVELVIPPLRDRRDEIAALAEGFRREAVSRDGGPSNGFDPAAIEALAAHDWPGNVRELRNRVERAVALSDAPTLTTDDLFPERRLDEPSRPASLADARALAEAEQIRRALEASGGRLSEAAQRLGVSRTTLWKRRRQYRA